MLPEITNLVYVEAIVQTQNMMTFKSSHLSIRNIDSLAGLSEEKYWKTGLESLLTPDNWQT